MKQTDIFYPHKTLKDSISLSIQCENIDNLKKTGNTFHIYDEVPKEDIKLKISAQVPFIETVLSEKNKNKCSDLLDVCLIVKSNKSAFRNSKMMERKGTIYSTKFVLEKNNWAGDVNLSSVLILKKNIDDEFGFAAEKGTQLGWSTEYKFLFDEPEEKKGGEKMDVSWESFSSQKLHWLNKYYSNDIYAIDLLAGKKMPKVYLNKDMNEHLETLLRNNSKRTSPKITDRNLMFHTITTGIFTQLITDAITDYKNLIDEIMQQEDNEDPENIADNAWDELPRWKQEILENYASGIIPECRKKDALDTLKSELCGKNSDKFFKEVLRKILNIVQNAMKVKTEKAFSDCAVSLLKKS
jgi:hypothetical protein